MNLNEEAKYEEVLDRLDRIPKIDKTQWGDGPWKNEADKKYWNDPTTGLSCCIRRTPAIGTLCGYVGVTKENHLYKIKYEEVGFEVHGGLTYSGHFNNKSIWWFGFDCAHSRDYCPAYGYHIHYNDVNAPSYKNINYVEKECTRLAKQIYEYR